MDIWIDAIVFLHVFISREGGWVVAFAIANMIKNHTQASTNEYCDSVVQKYFPQSD
jgi:hypothetical protein